MCATLRTGLLPLFSPSGPPPAEPTDRVFDGLTPWSLGRRFTAAAAAAGIKAPVDGAQWARRPRFRAHRAGCLDDRCHAGRGVENGAHGRPLFCGGQRRTRGRRPLPLSAGGWLAASTDGAGLLVTGGAPATCATSRTGLELHAGHLDSRPRHDGPAPA